jgi:hypothetical protein
MKILSTTHNGIRYKFRYLDKCGVVEVMKDDQLTYTIKWTGRLFVCDCPGSRYHGRCWHLSMIPLLVVQEDENDLWASLAEEIGVMKYKFKKERKHSGSTNPSWT